MRRGRAFLATVATIAAAHAGCNRASAPTPVPRPNDDMVIIPAGAFRAGAFVPGEDVLEGGEKGLARVDHMAEDIGTGRPGGLHRPADRAPVRADSGGPLLADRLAPHVPAAAVVGHPPADRVEELERLVDRVARLIGHSLPLTSWSAGNRIVSARLPAGIGFGPSGHLST